MSINSYIFYSFFKFCQLFYQQFTQKEVDLPLSNPEYISKISYPPLIKLQIIITKAGEAVSVQSFRYLEVKGIDQELSIKVEIASARNLEALDPKILGKWIIMH